MRKRSVIIYSVLTITGILALALILVAYFLRKLKITSLKLEEKNLVITRQNVTLDRIGKNKDRLMSIIAHDLRGTIGNQITAVEVLKRIEENEQPEIDRKRLLGNLKKSASYSLELLENLLLWSRLEEGASNFLPEPLRLNTLVHNCVSLYSETAAQKEIDIIEKIPLELSCSVDRIMMEAIFRNLISNAVKFSNSGDRIEVGLDQQGDQVHFWVRDQGIGMDQEQLERIRENGGYTRRGTANEKGAGMGISLVREFIQFHKGRLEISSEADKGSLFEVYFPCEND